MPNVLSCCEEFLILYQCKDNKFLVGVSVTLGILREWVANPLYNPQPGGSESILRSGRYPMILNRVSWVWSPPGCWYHKGFTVCVFNSLFIRNKWWGVNRGTKGKQEEQVLQQSMFAILTGLPHIINHHEHLSCFMQLYNTMIAQILPFP